jgi:hypothetical protein
VNLIESPGIVINNLGPFPGKFSQETQRIDAGTMAPPMIGDPSWSYVDSSGHFHAWNVNAKPSRIFTAEEKFITRTSLGCGEDAYEEWTESLGWFCTLCGDQIENPRRIQDPSPQQRYLPGLRSWNIEFEEIYEPKLWPLVRTETMVSVRIPALKGFGFGQTHLNSVSDGFSFMIHGIGEFARHG